MILVDGNSDIFSTSYFFQLWNFLAWVYMYAVNARKIKGGLVGWRVVTNHPVQGGKT